MPISTTSLGAKSASTQQGQTSRRHESPHGRDRQRTRTRHSLLSRPSGQIRCLIRFKGRINRDGGAQPLRGALRVGRAHGEHTPVPRHRGLNRGSAAHHATGMTDQGVEPSAHSLTETASPGALALTQRVFRAWFCRNARCARLPAGTTRQGRHRGVQAPARAGRPDVRVVRRGRSDPIRRVIADHLRSA